MNETTAVILLCRLTSAIARTVMGYGRRTVGKHSVRKLVAPVPDSTFQAGISILTKDGHLNPVLYGTYALLDLGYHSPPQC